jgi:thiamine-monophosphate kinase
MNEKEIVDRLRRAFPIIGDDAAVVGDQVITTDMLVEDVDFRRSYPLRLVARKSIAVNLSDIAAMGASPRSILIALAAPASVDVAALVDSLIEAARSFGVEIIGGDLSRADKIVIAVTAIGVTERPLLRSGARPGDRIYVSRPIGASAAGLMLLEQGWTAEGEPPRSVGYAEREFAMSAIQRHVDPEPEVALGVALSAIAEVTACIDISDGLSTDLHHLCDESGCGAEIERERLPIFPELLASGPALGIRPRDVVLHGGEEYALLFTCSLRESDLSTRLGRPVYAIGRITAERDVVLIEGGARHELPPLGFDHFVRGG